MKQNNVNIDDVILAYEDADEDRELWDRVCGWFTDKADKLEQKAARLKKRRLNRQDRMDEDFAMC